MSASKHKIDNDSNEDIVELKYVKKTNSKKLKATPSRDDCQTDDKECGQFSFAELPHEILLLIFKRLNMKEICQMAR
jgi:hypothetical protein